METSSSKVPDIGINYGQLAAVLNGVRFYLTEREWQVYSSLWATPGDYVSATKISQETGLGRNVVRWHIHSLRKRLGTDVIETHPRKWAGWRINLADTGPDFDYREEQP